MSHGDGPPSIFEGDDLPYWKIRMEAYLEALDVGILRAASQGFPKPRDAAHKMMIVVVKPKYMSTS